MVSKKRRVVSWPITAANSGTFSRYCEIWLSGLKPQKPEKGVMAMAISG
jgi:hypothetical protein